MTQIILDTSAYSGFQRGMPKALARHMTHEQTILVPVIVLGELRAGFANGSQAAKNEQLLQQFLSLPNVQVSNITDASTQIFARIFAQLRRAGTPIGQNDMWIAAIAMEHNLPLLTLDSDFSNIAGLKLVKL